MSGTKKKKQNFFLTFCLTLSLNQHLIPINDVDTLLWFSLTDTVQVVDAYGSLLGWYKQPMSTGYCIFHR